MEVTKIAEFILKYSQYKDDIELIKEYILKHQEYGTLLVEKDNEDIVAVCRWNIDGEVATILDLYIREDYRNKKFIQKLLKMGRDKFPLTKVIRFERQVKYPDREFRVLPINKILK